MLEHCRLDLDSNGYLALLGIETVFPTTRASVCRNVPSNNYVSLFSNAYSDDYHRYLIFDFSLQK
jgi:hypothetical protein